MSSSTATISSKTSTMNNSDRKRPISSSIRPSPSPPSAKRHGLSSSANSRHSTKKNVRQSDRTDILLKKTTDHHHHHHRRERQSRSKQQYRHIDTKSSSSESSRSSSNSNYSINQEYSSRTFHDSHSSTEKSHFNSLNNSKPKSDTQTDIIYTKKPTSLALIVKPSTKIDHRRLERHYDSDEEYEQKKQRSNEFQPKSTSAIVPSSVMTIVKTPDLANKSMRTDNVIIQQCETNVNPNSSTKLVKLVGPPTANTSSIKMLSSGDGLASALRIPTKIQLTKTSFVSSGKTDKTSSTISSTLVHRDQSILSPLLSTNLLDIPIDITENQQTIVDYQSSSTLPPTPPPPVIDHSNVRNLLSHTSHNQQEKEEEQQQNVDEISTNSTKAMHEIDSSTTNEHSNQQSLPKRHSLTLSDWSVPPTSELSPTSLTSSSPDLTQNHLLTDDLLVELDSTINFKESTKRRYRSLSSSCPILPSFTMSYLPSNDKTILKPVKSKSLTRLSKSSDMKLVFIHRKRSRRTSPILKLSASQRINKRRRDNENFVHHQQNDQIYKSKAKHLKIESNNQSIIKDLLNELVERIVSTDNKHDHALKALLNTSISHSKQTIPIDRIGYRQTNTETSVSQKSYSSSDTTALNDSRSMIMTSKELDELAYLFHANVHRGEYERLGNSAKVEERMREAWSQMSNQKKNSYYKRVIQLYQTPHRDVVIASSSSTIDKSSLSSNDSTDNSNLSSMSINSSSLELKRQTSTPLSFHSLPSSITDEQTTTSPAQGLTLRTNLSIDIVNELIKGAKGLDKLSYSPTAFVNSIHNFVQSTIDKQMQIVHHLVQQIEKKYSTQLNRATIFWTQKIQYFATKYQINSSDESMKELTLIVKYFYLLVLSLNCQKQATEFRTTLTDLLHGNFTFIDQSFCSSILTSIIEDLILPSSLANEYLASQCLIINDTEHALPWIRNLEFENELLNNNNEFSLSSSPFVDLNEFEDYLNRCEHTTINIPCYPFQQSPHPSMYYPTYHPSSQYYYHSPGQSSEVNNYYYGPTTVYPNSQQIFPYGQSPSYYHHHHHPSATYTNNEQFKYYCNPQQQASYAYSSHMNSTNDIPLSNDPSLRRTYRQMNSTIPRTYSTAQPSTTPTTGSMTPGTPSTPAVFDAATTVASSQSKPMNTSHSTYPP